MTSLTAGRWPMALPRGVWTSPMIARVVAQEFAVHYHPGHVRKVLKRTGFSVQRPRRQLAKADPALQDRWQRYAYPRLKKPHNATRPRCSPMKPVSVKTPASAKPGRAAKPAFRVAAANFPRRHFVILTALSVPCLRRIVRRLQLNFFAQMQARKLSENFSLRLCGFA